jgi:hypothetical protein
MSTQTQLIVEETRVSKDALMALRASSQPTTTSQGTQAHPPTGSTALSLAAMTVGPSPAGYPYQCIGLVQIGNDPKYVDVQFTGTAALVGPNFILTAAHLFPWGQQNTWMRFAAGYSNGKAPNGWIYVNSIYGFAEKTACTPDDFMVCQLASNLGDTLGWLGTWWDPSDSYYTSGVWASAGYSTQAQTTAKDVTITQVEDGPVYDKLLFTSDFAQGDWAGGPLWSPSFDIIAVFSGVVNNMSTFAGGIDISNFVNYGFQHFQS